MNRIILAILAFVTLSVTTSGCNVDFAPRATSLAHLLAANLDSKTGLDSSAAEITAWLDSIDNPARKIMARDLLMQVAQDHGDSTVLALRTIIYNPIALGSDLAAQSFSLITDSLHSPALIAHKINIVRGIYSTRQLNSHLRQFDISFQNKIDSLPINDRMRLYSRVASPYKLAAALRQDSLKSPADAAQAVEALRQIYDEDTFNEFLLYYSNDD